MCVCACVNGKNETAKKGKQWNLCFLDGTVGFPSAVNSNSVVNR